MAIQRTEIDDDEALMSEINITPFVDVVLVLLVIFMITAPALVKNSLLLKLPKSATTDVTASQTIGIAINKEGMILVNGVFKSEEELSQFFKEELLKNADSQALISADEETKHRDLVRVMDLLKSVGFQKFALQTEKKK